MDNIKELTPEELRRMQLLQLDMLAELDRVCRKNKIQYTILGGTLLGAVRHKGFIPWDDDIDVVMLREEYEKFKKVANQLDPQICWFQDHSTEPEYRWGFAKLRRTGTEYVRPGKEHMKCRTGVFMDIFPLDDVPRWIPAQIYQDFKCYCLRKILWAEAGKESAKGIKKKWFQLLSKIPVDFVYARLRRDVKKSRNDTQNGVRILLMPALGCIYTKNPLSVRYATPKKWFLEVSEYEFEGKSFWGVKDYDSCLKYIYGDYMTLPPEEKRIPHTPAIKIRF